MFSLPYRRRPLNVIMDLTERCNLKCVMCYFAEIDRLRFEPYNSLSDNGNMPVEVFEKVAADFFPRAHRVALGCAAEPMIHSKFRDILAVAGRYKVPDLWFPTNLLALTPATAEAFVDHGVTTVAASIDGTHQETYEKIRVGGKWQRLLQKLELLNETKKRRGSDRPRLRIIFTWMRSNREDLQTLPAFAAEHGAAELDVRYVVPTEHVDVTPELLTGEDPRELHAELASAARDAARRGIKLQDYPEFETKDDMPKDLVGRVKRRWWRVRSGLERAEHWHQHFRKRFYGCPYPGANYVIRPNGAVFPCIYWNRDPIGAYPQGDFASISTGEPLRRIREGLRCGKPAGTCNDCGQRRVAFYRPFRKPAS